MVKYYIGLSEEQPTREQYNSLLVWLDEHSRFTKIITVISPKGEHSTDYRFNSDFISDDVVDRIRRYYVCGKLYEQLDTSVRFRRQHNFKYKRESLGEALIQGEDNIKIDKDYKFENLINQEMSENMETKLNKQEVLNWLQEHEIAWEDFVRYFEDIYQSSVEVPMDEIIGWISDYDDLAEDFENKFGTNIFTDADLDDSIDEHFVLDLYDQVNDANVLEITPTKVKLKESVEQSNIGSNQYKAIIVNSTLVDFCGRDFDKPVVEDTIIPINIVANSDEEAAEIVLSKIYHEQADDSGALHDLNYRYSYAIAFEDFGQLDVTDSLNAVISLKKPDNVELITRSDIQVANANDALKQYKKFVREAGEYVKYQKISLGDEINLNDSGLKESVQDTYDDKWNIGSNKLVSTDSQEYANLVKLAKLLQERSANNYRYEVKQTYEDFGAGMQWYTIICTAPDNDSWQVLNTRDWLDLANGKPVEEVYNTVVTNKYFQDKPNKSVGSIFKWMDDHIDD